MRITQDFVDEAINKVLDEQLLDAPEEVKRCRGHMYRQLLDYYDEHGELPKEFVITKKGGK